MDDGGGAFAGWEAVNLDAAEQALVDFLERCPDGLSPKAASVLGRRSSRTPSEQDGKPSPVRSGRGTVAPVGSHPSPLVQVRKYSHTMLADLRTSKALQELNQEMRERDSKPKSNVSACCTIL